MTFGFYVPCINFLTRLILCAKMCRKGSAMSPTGQFAVHRTVSAPPVTVYQPTVVSGHDRVGKLRTELGTVQQNCRVLGEILTELSSGNGSPDDVELLEVISVCVLYCVMADLYPCFTAGARDHCTAKSSLLIIAESCCMHSRLLTAVTLIESIFVCW